MRILVRLVPSITVGGSGLLSFDIKPATPKIDKANRVALENPPAPRRNWVRSRGFHLRGWLGLIGIRAPKAPTRVPRRLQNQPSLSKLTASSGDQPGENLSVGPPPKLGPLARFWPELSHPPPNSQRTYSLIIIHFNYTTNNGSLKRSTIRKTTALGKRPRLESAGRVDSQLMARGIHSLASRACTVGSSIETIARKFGRHLS